MHPQRELAASPDAVDTEDQGAGELDLKQEHDLLEENDQVNHDTRNYDRK